MADAAVERAGRGVRKRMRRQRRELLELYAVPLLLIDAVFVVSGVVIVSASRALGAGEFQQGLTTGVFASACLVFPLYVLAMHGWFQRSMGGEAEVQTSTELRDHLERRSWSIHDDLLFDRGNVDHVIVGSGHVFVVETKWASFGVRVDRLLEHAMR